MSIPHKGKNLKYLAAIFIAAVLTTVLLPSSAQALTEGSFFGDVNYRVLSSGEFGKELPFEGGTYDYIWRPNSNFVLTDDQQLDLWVYTKNMTEEERESGKTIPYVTDMFGRQWKLASISLGNSDEAINCNPIPLLESDDISSARSKDDYVVDVSKYQLTPIDFHGIPVYYIYYGWQCTSGNGDTDPEQYSVTYDLNIPDNLPAGSVSAFPLLKDGDRYNLDIADTNGSLSNVESALRQLGKSVYSGQKYVISDFSSLDSSSASIYHDFLLFNYKSTTEYNHYYQFDGWTVEGDSDNTRYEIGRVIDDIASLDYDADKSVAFIACWKQIKPLDDSGVSQLEQQLGLELFEPATDMASGFVILTQSTDIDENDSNGLRTASPVTLDEQGVISYELSGKIDTALTGVKQDAITYSEGFATVTLCLSIDDSLTFANASDTGDVTLEFYSKYLKPTGININGNPAYATIKPTDPQVGRYEVVFTPNASSSGTSSNMDLQLTTQWAGGMYSKEDILEPFVLKGLSFRLSGDVDESNRPDFEIETQANLKASIDLSQISTNGQISYRYSKVWNQFSHSPEWLNCLGNGNVTNLEAYVHAVQLMDHMLADYDLAKNANASYAQANTVTATYPKTIAIKPVDMTIYMGGSGGYDAVVNESGEQISSNSLPHPLFTVDAPDGINPDNLTFTNGEKSWNLISDGNGYYHFSEEASKVRVTYSYEDASGKTHIVTDDEFKPSQDVYTTYTVALYSGDNAMSQVRAMAYNGANYVNAETGTLTVRAVQDEPDAVVSAISQDPPKSLESGSAVAVAGASTTYTLNNTGVALPVNDSKPSLLFDGIIDDDDHDRTAALVDAIEAQMNTSVDSECYQAKYLDLVDANNGNAWITASDAVTVYWGYPEGTDKNMKFTLYHFRNLHRDGANSGYDVSDISDAEIKQVTVEKTAQGIKFHVEPGGFSPFVLVWEEDSGGSVTPPAATHTITATAGEGGSISPSGEVSVRDGADQTFTITPDEGNKVRDVVVDGTSVGALGSYTFDDVREDHAISVTFTRGNAPADPDDTGVSGWFETGDHDAFLHGYDDGTGRFGPEDNMTRGEAAQMFYNMLRDKSRGSVAFDFEDLPEGAWYHEAVATLASHGILLGTSPTTVEPERPITRAEFTAMAMRFSKGDLSGENIFTDVFEGDWYYGVVVGSIKYGWISGYDDGTGRFGPNDNITRAQATIIANRMLGRVPDGVYINAHLGELTRFPDVSEGFYAFRDIVEATNSHDYSKDGGFEHWSGLR